MKKFVLLLVVIFSLPFLSTFAQARSQERLYKGAIIAEISLVEYYTGYREYWVNNDLPKSFRHYKILILGFDDQILFQEELEHAKAGNYFTLYFTNPDGVIMRSDIFALRIVIVEKTIIERILGAVKPITIDGGKKYFQKQAINNKVNGCFFIERIDKI